MSTVTKPMALDETFNTTESTPRNQADVLAGIQQAIREGFGQVAYAVEYDNTDSGLTATNVQDAVDEVDAALDVVEDNIENIENDIESIKEVTGNPITLTDGSETYAQGLSVELEPVQDLHGYDFPWVGGAGKNLFGGVYYDLFPLHFNANTTITVSADTKGGSGNIQVYYYDENRQLIDYWGLAQSGDRDYKTFEYPSTAYYIAFRQTESTNYQVEVGSVMTSYESYSNICPISGYEGVEVEDVGKNWFDVNDLVSGGINDNGTDYTTTNWRRTPFIFLKAGAYAVQRKLTTDWWKCYQYTSADQNAGVGYIFNKKSSTVETFIVNQDCYIRLQFDYIPTSADEIQLEKGTTATPYEPHTHKSVTVQFGQTVYGGSVDVTNGGTEKKYIIKKISDLSWTYRTISGVEGYVFVSNDISGIKQGQSPVMASCYRIKTNRNYIDGDAQVAISNNTTATDCVIKDDAYTDATTFTTARGDETLLFELAEYETLTTPKTDLKLLQDINNITTNGTTITIDYIPNNSIGDAVKASEEYTDRAVERVAVAPKATLIDTWMISEESDTISVDLTAYDCNFFLLEYLFQSKRGTTLIPRPQGGTFSASVVTYNNGTAYYIELDYNPTTKQLSYTSNITSQFGILAIYTI